MIQQGFMQQGGDYYLHFAWLRPTPSSRSAAGEQLYSSTNLGYLWGVYETPTANREDRQASIHQVTRVTVRIRNWIDVRPNDTLQAEGEDWIWRVETAVRGVDEMICDLIRP